MPSAMNDANTACTDTGNSKHTSDWSSILHPANGLARIVDLIIPRQAAAFLKAD
jgi:hypothetical protein